MVPNQPTKSRTTVYVIDDHPDELLLVERAARSIGVPVETFQSPHEFLDQLSADAAGCVVADLIMPKMTGLQLHQELMARGCRLPVIVVTGQANAKVCREALQNGVFDFVEKSWNPFDILDVVQRGLAKYEEEIAQHHETASTLERLESVSSREKEVMSRLAVGRTLKEIAIELGISVQTASKHRSSLFGKLDVTNEVDMLKKLIAIDPKYGSRQSDQLIE